MRKIVSKDQKDKSRRKNQLVIGLILIFLMLFSTIGFAFNSNIHSGNEETIRHNGVEFIRDINTGYWEFNIENTQFLTRYNTKEVEDIQFISDRTLHGYANEPLYFVGDSIAFSEFDINLRDRFVLRIEDACLEDCQDLPRKSCSEDNIIIIEEPIDGKERIYQEDNCTYIIANAQNQLRYADAYLFSLLGL